MGTLHPVPDRVKPSFVIFDIRALWRSALSVRVPGCQKNANDGLTWSGTGCFIAVPMWHQWISKGSSSMHNLKHLVETESVRFGEVPQRANERETTWSWHVRERLQRPQWRYCWLTSTDDADQWRLCDVTATWLHGTAVILHVVPENNNTALNHAEQRRITVEVIRVD